MRKIIRDKLEGTKKKSIGKITQPETTKNLTILTPIKLRENLKKPYRKSVSPDSLMYKLRRVTPEPNISSRALQHKCPKCPEIILKSN